MVGGSRPSDYLFMKNSSRPGIKRASSNENQGMRRRRGQVVVETAIIMPVFVFLILGLLQMGLMHHARVLAKYAAYKAVRAGSLNRGENAVMTKAALAVMVPVLGRNSTSGAPHRVDSVSRYNTAWQALKNNDQGGVPFVEVAVCSPSRSQVAANADFDDPRKALQQNGPAGGNSGGGGDPSDPAPPGGGANSPSNGTSAGQSSDWRGFNATKLQIQVTVFYRMYIPFANYMVWRLAVGEEAGSPHRRDSGQSKMRWLGWRKDPNAPRAETLKNRLMSFANQKKYIMPIRASYAMRMQSNFTRTAHSSLPNGGNGTSSACKISWPRR